MRIAHIFAAAALMLASACSGPASVKDAEAAVAAFHANLDKSDYDAVWKSSSDDLKKSEGKEKLTGLLTAIHERFGKVKASKQQGWHVNYNNGVSTTEVTMDTTYEKGSLEEKFLFLNTDDGLKLTAYQFNQK